MEGSIGVEVGKIIIGETFVKLSQELFGGMKIPVGDKEEVGEIDIVDFEKKRCIEVKGSHYKDRFMILERQYLFYKKLSEGKYGQRSLFFQDPEIYYTLFSHKVKPVGRRFDKEEELENELLNNIDSLMIVSFDVINQIYNKCGVYITKNRWYNYLSFKRKDVRLFFQDLEKALTDLDLDIKDYNIKESVLSNNHTNEFRAVSIINNGWKNGNFLEGVLECST